MCVDRRHITGSIRFKNPDPLVLKEDVMVNWAATTASSSSTTPTGCPPDLMSRVLRGSTCSRRDLLRSEVPAPSSPRLLGRKPPT